MEKPQAFKALLTSTWGHAYPHVEDSNSQSTRRSHSTNAERRAIVKEFECRQNVGEDMSQKDLAEWGFKELQLTTMPSQPTMSRLCNKRSHSYDECLVNLNRKRK